ncbi:MAG TPA: DUF5916 domain-containing protein [Vicinamibacterales bacterium]|nr:DUF5916 domain-containing protein [Vicinamibacterales bacterium]
MLVVPVVASAQSIEILGPPPPQEPEVFAKDDRGRITIRATRATLDVDGNLDEEIYSRVPAIDHFVQQEPDEGDPATEKTLAWLFFDDQNFYVSVRSYDSQPDRLVANELRRDNFNIFQNDNVTISIDSLYTRRSGVFFQMNALGAQRDQEVQDERSNNNDWNTIWDVQAKILADGWSMEFAIPYSSLRFRSAGPQVWGFNLRRVIRYKNEHVSIAPIPASATTRAMYKFDIMATVVGVEVPSVRRPIDVKPYAIAASTTNLLGANPFRNDPSADAGFDVKYSVTNSLVADFTYRTDFAQVEEDQQQINLTRFSLFFPEKRDFFLEGQGLFSFGAEQRGGGGGGQTSARSNTPSLTPVVFYSRRIGLGSAGEIPIVGGGRLSGRAGKFGIGLLNIQTEQSAFAPGGATADLVVPSTNFAVVRVRRDILRRSNVGFIATRRTPEDGAANTVFGADANLWFGSELALTSYFARSHFEGREERTDGTDSVFRSASYRAEVDYQPDRYGFKYEHLLVGSQFQPEIGFLRRSAFRRNYAMGRFSPRPSAGPVRRHVFEGEFDYITGSDDGRLETREAKVAYRVELRGNDQFGIDFSRNYEFLRQGFFVVPGRLIPAGIYEFGDFRTVFVFGAQRRVSGSIAGGHGSFYDGTNSELSYRGLIEISNRFNVEPGLTLNWIDIEAGKFRTTVGTLRSSYMFSPRMALSALVQYNSTAWSLGSSVRFRWEYRPGSDFFVVYSDGRDTRIGDPYPGLINRTFVVKATRLFRF